MPLKVLFSEGSSTSARQSLYALGRLGHAIDICDPQRLCLGRFSRYVRRLHRCPSFTDDPLGYLKFLADLLQRESYDVFFPVHDQVYLLARFPEVVQGRTAVALPPFAAIAQLQSKVGFARVMTALDLPQPRTTIVNNLAALPNVRDFPCDYPCYIKLEYSTAGRGVWRVENAKDLQAVIDALQQLGNASGKIVVQQAVTGNFHVAQAVFAHGELVAACCYRARAQGVGGSAHARQHVVQPLVYQHLARLGQHLAWHGPMHLEYLCDPANENPIYIEANPRIGETMNATLAGLNLCELTLRVALGEESRRALFCDGDTRTHSVLMSLMAKAESGEGRLGIVREMGLAWTAADIYRDSQDELIRPSEDPLSLFPAIFLATQLLIAPNRSRRIIQQTVDNYSLNAEAVRRIDALPASIV